MVPIAQHFCRKMGSGLFFSGTFLSRKSRKAAFVKLAKIGAES